jgi:hypothetical protein
MLSCGMSLERRIPSTDSVAVLSATSVPGEFRRFGKADGVGGSRRRKTEQLANIARPNPPKINTSANFSFFIKSLIMNDLKSNRISKRANKSPRISTSGHYGCKSSRINTSRNHPGEGGSTIRVSGSTARRSRRLLADTPGRVKSGFAAAGRKGTQPGVAVLQNTKIRQLLGKWGSIR